MSDGAATVAAAGPVRVMTARVGALLHVGELVIGAPLLVLSADRSVNRGLLYATIAGYAVWIAVHAPVVWRRGLIAPMVIGDIAVTVGLCLINGQISPLSRVDEGSGWVATIASMTIIGIAMAWPARAAVPAGVLVIVAFQAGFFVAGLAGKGLNHTAIMVIQVISAVAVLRVLRRVDAAASAAIAAEHRSRQATEVQAARRVDETAQLRVLHDTALTTLTLVGIGALPARSPSLTERAAADLMVIEHLAAAYREHSEERWVRLDQRVEALAADPPLDLTVSHDLVPCHVPKRVAESLVSSAAEALRNVARHAGVMEAQLILTTDGGRVRVDVIDMGKGFDPAAAPVHRFGIRESIVGRMASVGGAADVDSTVGVGTRWRLHWPAERVAG
ncbi:ATP-binding protein [Luedemannella flava]|uniref:ATP-binding protein n=1 Tax=Luedemannella flava TaxID=349316 RepID=A0ABP4XRV1_9ACTN